MAHYFLSYSTIDGNDFALRLYDELRAGPPPIDVWMDKRHRLIPGADWQDQVDEAIRSCRALLLVLTRDSVTSQSVVRREWMRALQFKKPVVPLLLHDDAIEPLQLVGRQQIPFVTDFEAGLAGLRRHVAWLDSPDGELYELRNRRADSERELARSGANHDRIELELADIDVAIADLEHAVSDPPGTLRAVNEQIERGLESERDRATPVTTALVPAVNRPPATAPSYFQDRVVETRILGDYLEDDSLRLIRVVGRAGVGKTAMASRALAELERGAFPDDRMLEVGYSGIVYLGAGPARDISFPNIYADLGKLLPAEELAELGAAWLTATDISERVLALASAFARRRTVVLLDNFEDVLESETWEIGDPELSEALSTLLQTPGHGIKFVLTTRVDPRDLALRDPGRQVLLNIGSGLASPYAENLLRALDRDGMLGLQDAPDELLGDIRDRTLGLPRALEAFVAILAADPYSTAEELLGRESDVLPDNVVAELVAEAFHRLDPRTQRVMEALAIYPQPVIPEAVDLLLRPYVPGVHSERMLRRLVGMSLARRDQGRYWLHPVDRSYALSQVPEGEPSDWRQPDPPYSLAALRHRGAEFFRAIRMDRHEQQSLEDARPEIAELELLVDAGDPRSAWELLDGLTDRLDSWGHGREMIRLALLIGDTGDPAISPVANALAGVALTRMGNHRRGAELLEAAVAAGQDAIDPVDVLFWRIELADALRALGRYDDAEALLGECLDSAHDLPPLQAKALERLGFVRMDRNDFSNAGDLLQRALETLVSTSTIAVEEDGSISPAEMVEGLPYPVAAAWVPTELMLSSDDAGESGAEDLAVFGIAVPSDQPPEDPDTVEVQLVAVDVDVAGLWLNLAQVFALQDRVPEAWSAAVLAETMYMELESAPGVADALDVQRQVASQLDEAQAAAIVRQQEQALASAREQRARKVEIVLMTSLATTYHLLGRLDRATETYAELRQIALGLEDQALRVQADIGLARIDWTLDRNDEAAARLHSLLEQDVVEQVSVQFQIHLLLGRIEKARFDLEAAERHYWSARRLGAPSPLAELDLETALADVDLARRNYAGAVQGYERAVEIAEIIGTPSTVIEALSGLADSLKQAGDHVGALAATERAIEHARETGLPLSMGAAYQAQGWTLAELERYDEAEAALKAAGDIYAGLNSRLDQISVLSALQMIYERSDRYAEELEAARRAEELAKDTGDVSTIRRTRQDVALALADLGRMDEAVARFAEVVEQDPHDATAIGNQGWILYLAGDYDASIRASERALTLDPAQVFTIRNLAHAHLAAGRPDDAAYHYRRAIESRRGGEDFRESIRVVRKLLEARPDTPRGYEMLGLLEEAQAGLTTATEEPPDQA